MADNSVDLECYILSEQPSTCRMCGARTSFVEENDGTQIHQCLNRNCSYSFIGVFDTDWSR